ncbi:MAG: peroxidase [Calditrichaeota bacterium]|nr:MAG: peroxidase [Calditrichota bacterium]
MTHHGEALRQLTKDEDLVKTLKQDYRNASLSSADRAMLDYVYKLTVEPWKMAREDVEKLRKEGFADADILDINQVAAYFAFVNRLADGLGVELEDYWDET